MDLKTMGKACRLAACATVAMPFAKAMDTMKREAGHFGIDVPKEVVDGTKNMKRSITKTMVSDASDVFAEKPAEEPKGSTVEA